MTTSHVRKAAILLHGLPDAAALQLRSKLAPEHETALAAQLETLGDVDKAEEEAILREFATAAAQSLRPDEPSQDEPFGFLREFGADALVDLLADEHPQTIAVVLSYLSPNQAAAVLAELAADQQLSVICRLATMREPDAAAIRDVEQALRSRLHGTVESPVAARGVLGVVEMFHAMEPAAERRLLNRLAEAEPELVREIRRAMFGMDTDSASPSGAVQVAC